MSERSAEAQAQLQRGAELAERGRWREALPLLRAAVVAAPTVAAGHSALGRVLLKLGDVRAALAAHAIAVQLAPGDAEALYRCALAQRSAGRWAEAEATLRRAIERDAGHAPAHDALAQVWFEAGRLDEALAQLRERAATGPATALTHDMLVFYPHFHPASTRASLHAEHAAWNARHAALLRAEGRSHGNERSPERRLRVGYVSADFRRHPVAQALAPLFAGHDRERFEIVAYHCARESDEVTDRLRAAAEWRDAAAWSDAELAGHVRADAIDVLVDLSLHTTRHRLFAFARKPAPVQVTWAGYPGSTGLDAVDYRLTDRFLDPPEWGDAHYAERSVRLPDSFWCYDPLDAEPPVNPLPAATAGAVTFGCLNKCAKVNAPTVALWAPVLRAVPTSRLIVRAASEVARGRLQRLFAAQGIDATRLEFVGWRPRFEYLALHHRIDIALDPTPYGGHMTLLDGLWMGVPTIALPGETAVSRAGLSLLANAGLSDWVAATPEDFVRIAVEQTRDVARLAALRARLRARLRASPLMDGARFARGVENAYREMWRAWCAGARP